ncbi:hypothetical protein CYMTET_33640, partial [Cymbomonas tetramitiformis]
MKPCYEGARVILLLVCASQFTAPRAHTTDVCWIWSNNGQGITFYVGTWHDTAQECDVYSTLNSLGEVEDCTAGTSGCLFCPLLVTSTSGEAYLHEGHMVEVDSVVSQWTCRGYCDQTYGSSCGCDRKGWTSFYVDVPCGTGIWTIDAPNHYIYDPVTVSPAHYCTIDRTTYVGAKYKGVDYNWIGNNEGTTYSNPIYTWDSTC